MAANFETGWNNANVFGNVFVRNRFYDSSFTVKKPMAYLKKGFL